MSGPADIRTIRFRGLEYSGPFAFGRGEDEAPLIDRRFSFGGGVLDPVGEAPVTDIPGPPLVFGLSGEVNAWLKLRLLPVAVDGRSVIVEVVVGYGYPGENSIPCRNVSKADYSNKFTIIYYLFPLPED